MALRGGVGCEGVGRWACLRPHHKDLLFPPGNFGDRYFGTDAVPDGSDDEEGGSTG